MIVRYDLTEDGRVTHRRDRKEQRGVMCMRWHFRQSRERWSTAVSLTGCSASLVENGAQPMHEPALDRPRLAVDFFARPAEPRRVPVFIAHRRASLGRSSRTGITSIRAPLRGGEALLAPVDRVIASRPRS